MHYKKGMTTLGIIIAVVVVLVIGIGGYFAMQTKRNDSRAKNDAIPTQLPEESANTRHATPTSSAVLWENTAEGGWLALDGTPPACPEPFTIKSPADISKATSILYPGQERRGDTFSGAGGNYKPHGAFRFDGSATTDIKVSSPIDGYVYRGSQYLTEGEIQYTFDIINRCGMMVRLGHLRDLSPQFKAFADKFPAAQEGDSRTERVTPITEVKAGDLIATEVGLRTGKNTFFDLGVYDLRKKNAISQTAAYQSKHADNKELAWHAVCWFDMLPAADATKVKSLPAGDPDNGKTSDYCK